MPRCLTAHAPTTIGAIAECGIGPYSNGAAASMLACRHAPLRNQRVDSMSAILHEAAVHDVRSNQVMIVNETCSMSTFRDKEMAEFLAALGQAEDHRSFSDEFVDRGGKRLLSLNIV